MASHGIKDQVAIIGMGCTQFKEHWDRSTDDLLVDAVTETLESAGVAKEDVDAWWLGTAQSGMSGVTLAAPLKLQGKPVTIYGEGTQTRAFCFVDDLVDGLIRLMDTPDEVTGPVNLGNPHEITVRELAERVLALCGDGAQLERRPLPQDDPTRRCPDISLARRLLDWEPKVPLEEGLRRTVAYFDARLREGQAGG